MRFIKRHAHFLTSVAAIFWIPFSFADFFSAPRQAFKDFNGKAKKPVDFVTNEHSFILISFWADWCVACKQEIEMLAKNSDRIAKISVVTVNIDEDAQFLQAKSFLENSHAKFNALRDPAGSYFFTASPDGSLPFVVLFDRDGRYIRSYSEFHQTDLDELIGKADEITNASDTDSFQHYVDFRAKVKTRNPQLPGENSATVQTSQFQYSAAYQKWDFKLTHHALMQKRPLDKEYLSTEDELGFTYLQWSNPASVDQPPLFYLGQVRLGSDQKHILNGLLLSIKSGPEEAQNTRLDGGHLSFNLGGADFKVFSGLIKNQLYPANLDPTVDMSKKLPRQIASGFTIGIGQSKPESQFSHRLELGFTKLERERNESLGYLSNFSDKRVGATLDLGLAGVSIRNTVSSYQNSETTEDGKAYFSEVSVPLTQTLSTQLAAAELNLNHTGYEYIALPNLAGDYSRPLTTQDRQSRKLAAQWDAPHKSGSPYVHFEYIEDNSLPKSENDQLSWTNSFTTGLSEYSGKLKYVNIHQLKKDPSETTLDENILSLTTPTGIANLGMRAEHRKYRSLNLDTDVDLSGERNGGGFQYRYSIDRDYTLVGSIEYNRQGGFYLTDSGLTKKHLRQFALQLENQTLNASVRYGQEAGGIVCTTAGCSYRNGHDGLQAELSISHVL